jgi:hypothetical protein
MAKTSGRVGLGSAVVLRRQPARVIVGGPEGGYTSMFEIICCDCGDDPSLDYREVSPRLQRIRGPYPVAAGIAAYQQHLRRHPDRPSAHQPGRPSRDANASAGRRGPPGMTRPH